MSRVDCKLQQTRHSRHTNPSVCRRHVGYPLTNRRHHYASQSTICRWVTWVLRRDCIRGRVVRYRSNYRLRRRDSVYTSYDVVLAFAIDTTVRRARLSWIEAPLSHDFLPPGPTRSPLHLILCHLRCYCRHSRRSRCSRCDRRRGYRRHRHQRRRVVRRRRCRRPGVRAAPRRFPSIDRIWPAKFPLARVCSIVAAGSDSFAFAFPSLVVRFK